MNGTHSQSHTHSQSNENGGIIAIDPELVPLSQHQRVYDGEIREAAAGMIRSVSGWRTVFAPGNESESMSSAVPPVLRYLAAAMAVAFTKFRQQKHAQGSVILACDARPTGAVLADTMLRAFTGLGVSVRFAGILSSPQAVALVQSDPSADGMCYITASHNPPGYNGVKWGDGDGKVLASVDAAEVSKMLDTVLKPPELAENLRRLVNHAARSELRRILDAQGEEIRKSAHFYRTSIIDRASRGAHWREIAGLMERSIVVADFNGSARTTGIDESLLSELSASLIAMHNTPGDVGHKIEPEGHALDECSTRVTELVRAGKPVALGYVPDNDGDRGNLVFPAQDQARVLAGQDVFCLAVIAELSWLTALGNVSYSRLAIVVNGPTSLRINTVARAFGATVFRAEVGEANVVGKAEELRRDGWFVPILGEGSNGGNITSPSTIRDPMSTIISMLRLVSLSGSKAASAKGAEVLPGGHPLSCALRALNREREESARASGNTPSAQEANPRSGAASPAGPDAEEYIPGTPAECFDLLRKSLPEFETTPVTSENARINVGTIAHGLLKQRVEALLPDRISDAIRLLAQPDVTEATETESNPAPGLTWEVKNFEGTQARTGTGNRDPSGDGTGGFAVWFLNEAGRPCAFVWMRGSRTEPAFRVIADVSCAHRKSPDCKNRPDALLLWFRSLISECIY